MRDVAVMASGDEALEDLYRTRRAALLRLAFLMTGSSHVAEDVVHDAFIRIRPHLGSLRDPVTYLRKIVVNRSLEHHRRVGIEQRHTPAPPGPALPPELDETWDALWQLPERQRTALVLRFYEDLPVREVAAALGCRLGTAKSLIHRGVGSLREVLRDDDRR